MLMHNIDERFKHQEVVIVFSDTGTNQHDITRDVC